MGMKKALVPFLVMYALVSFACKYIVLPEMDAASTIVDLGWHAIVTGTGETDSGGLRIDLAIRNDTGDWSAMQAVPERPAVLTAGGETIECASVTVGTGGHRLAPGFQMRGFIGGTKSEQQLMMLAVECEDAQATPGAILSIDYSYVTGQYNYYEQDKNKVDARMEIDLDAVVTDLIFPVGEPIQGLVHPSDGEIVALNDVVLVLSGIQRSSDGLQFSWRADNPGEYPTYVHIGTPPVIGTDGILYGFYETPDIVSVPITPAGDATEWTTQVAVPQDASGFYILLSAESGKARLFANYAIDITDQ
jgi:hypothetical protein